jgi:histidyl-tRNA synthetase
MENIKAPRGVRDILPDESWKWASIFEVTRKIAEDFGYKEVHLPIFEQTELFSRGIGETTDVVEKEMYTFSDRSGRSLTLRPEATASMVRAYLEHAMANGPQPSKLWCAGPMMRYERPQKGRYRQFWQLDFEAIGSSSPLVDVEVIALSLEIFRRLGLANLEVLVNSVGCPACRPIYRTALQEYLGRHFDSLCPTCQGRFDRNPLRILDCKVESCKAITDGAPDVRDHLCGECRDHFDAVLKGLDLIGAKFRIDKRLVRGLDYYTKTAYEVLSGDLGAQNAVCGGGRYDNLAEAIGGPHTPGVGFAAGLDRIVLTMEQQGLGFGTEPSIFATVVVAEEGARDEGMRLLYELRKAGVPADMDTSGKGVKAQMKAAGTAKSAFVCLLGSSEIEKGVVAVKEMGTGTQEEIERDRVVADLAARAGSARC